MPVVDDVLQQVGVGAARDDIEEAARFGMAISSVTEGGGLVDAPGRWLEGAKGEYLLREPFLVRCVVTERARMRRTSGMGRSVNFHETAFEVPIGHTPAEV
jgi:hypothetical protein